MKKSVLSLVLAFVLLLSGCGLRPAETAPAEQPEKTDSPISIPDISSENVYGFRFFNATGQDIYAISFREATVSEDYTENLLAPGFVLNDGNWMDISYDSSEAEKAFEALENTESRVKLTSEYRMLIVLKDGRHYELSAFPLGDMEDCTVLLSDNVAYLSYSSLCTEQLIITKQAELAIYEQWGRQARDISSLVSQLPSEPVSTVPLESPPPTEIPEGNIPEESKVDDTYTDSDPNAGCLTGGLFY